MDAFSTIVTVLCTLLGVLGGGSFFYFRSNKRIKAAEAKLAEIQTEHSQSDEWIRLYNESEEERKALQDSMRDVLAQKDELHNKLIEKQYKIGELELENQSLKWHKCVVKGCGCRKPPRDIDEVNEQNTNEA